MKEFFIDGKVLTVNDVPTLAAAESDGASFVLADGRHELSAPLTFDGLGSVSLRPADGAHPVISAAREVKAFTEATVNGAAVWSAPLPDGCESANQAFDAAGRRVPRPRLPADGFYRVAGVPGFDEPFKTGRNDRMGAMNYNDGELPSLSRQTDVEIRVFHWWTDELLAVKSVDSAARTVTFVDPSTSSLRCESSETVGARWYADNVFEALGQTPGQYYIDRAEKIVYYVPRPEDTLASFTLYLPALDSLMSVKNLKGTADAPALSVSGIAFSGSDWRYQERKHSQSASDIPSAIYIAESSYVAFKNCVFTNIGSSAVCVDTGSAYVTFEGCAFTDIGGNAVNIFGVNGEPSDCYPANPKSASVSPSADVIHDVRVTDCLIKSYGRVFFNAAGILLKFAHHCELSHNEICDGYYTGISVGWVWGYRHHATNHILIEKNHIYNIGQTLLSDMGGIYTLGRQPGTVIRGNLIHDVEMDSYGGWAIYPDEGSSDILIENNVCYRVTAQPFHQHYGANNLVRNNIFAFGEGGQMIVTRVEEHLSVIFQRNILVSDGTALYAKPAEALHIADDSNLLWNYSGEALSGAMSFNVSTRSYSFPPQNQKSFAAMHNAGLYKNAKIADPLFRSPKTGDFTLLPGSPALAMDFEQIDLSDVGVRGDGGTRLF